jgi:CheY-like chemotaxis protein
MSDDSVSVRILAVCGSEADCEQLRQGATLAVVPADFSHAATASTAQAALAAGNVDIVLVDSTMEQQDLNGVFKAVRAGQKPPSVVMVAPSAQAAADLAAAGVADAIAVKPAKLPDAKALIESCVRLKVPSRVLVVDDSTTIRGIVRKILSGCRFPLEILEAEDGIDALKQVNAGKFDLVFLDYNMPGLDGIEMLAQLKQQHPQVEVIMTTSAPDATLAQRARAAGAVAFLKKPFYPSDVDAVLYGVHRLRPQPVVSSQ